MVHRVGKAVKQHRIIFKTLYLRTCFAPWAMQLLLHGSPFDIRIYPGSCHSLDQWSSECIILKVWLTLHEGRSMRWVAVPARALAGGAEHQPGRGLLARDTGSRVRWTAGRPLHPQSLVQGPRPDNTQVSEAALVTCCSCRLRFGETVLWQPCTSVLTSGVPQKRLLHHSALVAWKARLSPALVKATIQPFHTSWWTWPVYHCKLSQHPGLRNPSAFVPLLEVEGTKAVFRLPVLYFQGLSSLIHANRGYLVSVVFLSSFFLFIQGLLACAT